jgi:nicotinate-nucleotide adenylyltransferase
MLAVATAGDPRFEISTIELDRDGPSYTVDTLERLRSVHPGDTLLLVVGPDALASFPSWHRPDRILELAELLPVEREGLDDLEQLRRATPAIETLIGHERLDRIIASRVRMPPIEVRSTDLRRAIAEGRPLRGLTPPAVEEYICGHGLYGFG